MADVAQAQRKQALASRDLVRVGDELLLDQLRLLLRSGLGPSAAVAQLDGQLRAGAAD